MARSQKGFIPISLIMYAVAALAVMAAIATLVYKVNHWCNKACVAQTERADKAEAAIEDAHKRATAMVLLWDKERQGREQDAKQRDVDRTARFAPILAASRSLPADVARTPFPAAAVVVLERAIDAGNASITRPSGEPPEATGPAPTAPAGVVDAGGLTEWGVNVSGLYATCVDRVHGWEDFYTGLRNAQVAEAVH